MKPEDFAAGLVPGLHIKGFRDNPTQRFQVEKWIRDGLLVCHGNPNPDPVMDQLWYVKPGIDRTAWPYICGRMARGHGKSRDSHGLIGNSERLWVAGWDEGGK